MIYLIEPSIVNSGCKTNCSTFCNGKYWPLYGIPPDSL